MVDPLTIVFVGASPAGVHRLRLDREVRSIRDALDRGEGAFTLETFWSSTDRDLQDALARRPTVLHFGGHARPDGLMLESPDGKQRLLPLDQLARLFATLSSRPRLVVLSACDSRSAAAILAPHVQCVVGMVDRLGDEAACAFAFAFYLALARGESVARAVARAQAAASPLGQEVQVEAFALPGAAERLYLTQDPALSEVDRALARDRGNVLLQARRRALRTRPDEGLAAGQLFADRYELEVELGRGAFGQVWRALDLQLGRLVAVKVLHRDLGERPQGRFSTGLRRMAGLVHPHIASVLDGPLTSGDRLGGVLELLDRDLGRVIEADEVVTWQIPELIQGIASALALAHAQGVVHRDIKPANIVLAADGRAKLTDFDLVHVEDTGRLSRTAHLGTLAYMAPELATPGVVVTPAADQVGLAMTAAALLRGKPLENDPEFGVFDRAELLAALPIGDAVRAVLSRAIHRRPAERWPDIGAFAHALAAAWNQDGGSPGSAEEAVGIISSLHEANRFAAAGAHAAWLRRQPWPRSPEEEGWVRRVVGRAAMEAGELDRAREELEEAVRHVPGWFDAVMDLWGVLLQLKDWTAGVALWRDFRTRVEEKLQRAAGAGKYGELLAVMLGGNRATCLDELAFALRMLDQYGAAIEPLEQLVAARRARGSSRELGLALMHLGRALRKAGPWSEAEAALRDALPLVKNSDDFCWISQMLAEGLADRARWPEAEGFFRRGLEAAGEASADEEGLLRAAYAEALAARGRVVEAEEVVVHARSPEKKWIEAMLLRTLGAVRGRAGRWAQAEADFERARQVAAGDTSALAAVHEDAAWERLAAGHLAEAEAGFQTALALEPSRQRLQLGQARTLLAAGCLTEAEAALHALTQMATVSWLEGEALHVRGMIARRQGRLHEAESFFARSVELLRVDDTHAEGLGVTLDHQARCRIDRGQWAEALDLLREGVRLKALDPTQPERLAGTRCFLALALSRVGRQAEAKAVWAEVPPFDVMAVRWIHRAEVLEAYAVAASHFATTAEEHERAAELRTRAAEVLRPPA